MSKRNVNTAQERTARARRRTRFSGGVLGRGAPAVDAAEAGADAGVDNPDPHRHCRDDRNPDGTFTKETLQRAMKALIKQLTASEAKQ